MLGKALLYRGDIVTKDLLPYAIVGGNPARVIKYRFDKSTIQKLINVDYSKIDKEFIEKNEKSFYKHVDDNLIDEIFSLVPPSL